MADTYQQQPPQQRPTRTGLLILLSRLWMLGLVVMAIEKTTTAGPRLAAPVGASWSRPASPSCSTTREPASRVPSTPTRG